LDRFTSLDDQFFNIRFSQLIRKQGFDVFNNFHWIYFSKFSQENQIMFSNPLFYIFLTLFTYVNPLFFGIKLYAIFSATLLFTTLFYFLVKIKEKNAFLWTILFFAITSNAFIWKMLMARAFVIAPAFLLLLLLFAYNKKYGAIFVVSCLYFFWHTATFFLPVVVVLTYFLFENFYGKKLDWKLIGSSLLGTFVAVLFTLIFFPKGFNNFIDSIGSIYGIFHDTIIGKSISIAEGMELYPMKFFDLLKSNFHIFLLLIVSISFEVYNYIASKKSNTGLIEDFNRKVLRSTLFFLSILFFLGMFITARNVDFFNFLAFAYVALAINTLIRYISVNNAVIKKSLIYGFIISAAYLFIANGLALHDTISSAGSYDKIKNSAEWLAENTNKNEIVFNVTWDWFPMLFYYNTHNYYIAGAEPRAFYDYNHELYWQWWHISKDGFLCNQERCDDIASMQGRSLKKDDEKKIWYKEEGDLIAAAIVNNFKSHFIITSKDFIKLNDLMDNNNRFEKVYTDSIYNTFFIYRVD